jgi:uncharacterized integral membrane protein (TIGR00698 family)
MSVIPGISLASILALAAYSLHRFMPEPIGAGIGPVLLGLALGITLNFIGNCFTIFQHFRSGIRWSFNWPLKTAIVLLGARITLDSVMAIGAQALVLVGFTMSASLILTHWLSAKLGVPKKLGALIGIGSAVCGNTAISATGPAIQADEDEISFAIATNTLFGTVAGFLYHLIGQYLELGDNHFGLWAGTAVNDTSQVIAAGFSFSPQAGEIATTVKLTRNALMGLVIVLATSLYGPQRESGEKIKLRDKIKLPAFVWGFLAVAVLNSLGLINQFETWLNWSLVDNLKLVIKSLILLALTAVGLNTNLRSFAGLGIKPLFVGISASATVSLLSLTLIYLLF